MDDFANVVQRVSATVLQCIEEGSTLNGQFDAEADPIYLKAVDGRILHTNQAYDKRFSDKKATLGRHASSFLAESIAQVSRQSDDMLLAGAMTVQFDHLGHDSKGREVKLRTFKRTLLGHGHPTIAILGITRVLEVVGSGDAFRLQGLKDQWRLFSQFDDLDRAISFGLGRGKSVRELAEDGEVTKKTIENHRSAILKTLGLKAPIDLVKLMVRFQENGFGDFGV